MSLELLLRASWFLVQGLVLLGAAVLVRRYYPDRTAVPGYGHAPVREASEMAAMIEAGSGGDVAGIAVVGLLAAND